MGTCNNTRNQDRKSPCYCHENTAVKQGETDFEYIFETDEKEVLISSDSGDEDTQSEDLEATALSLQRLSYLLGKTKLQGQSQLDYTPLKQKQEVIDDFIRNFLIKMGLKRTLDVFQTEWFEMKANGKLLESKLGPVPDEYTRRMQLEEVLSSFKQQLHQRLRRHFSQYEPIIRELKRKYEVTLRQKALLVLERDKLREQIAAIAHQEHNQERSLFCCSSKDENILKGVELENLKPKEMADHSKESNFDCKPDPLSIRSSNSSDHHDADPTPVKDFNLQRTFKGHLMPISNVAIHPRKPVMVTASDDATWKMWGLPEGDLIMTGDGHKEWVAGLDFHPRGMQLSSSSGDCTVKVWSFEKARCVHTFADHTQAVWSVSYHDSGEVLASASLDHTARIWDLTSAKCRGTLRGHVDSVNGVMWKHCSSILCTASSDKTVSLWDARTTLCVQTFYGHQASCNHAAFDPKGILVASVDALGIVKLWDIRKVLEFSTIDTGPSASNKCTFDNSAKVLASASNDGKIKCFQIDGEVLPVIELCGHEDAVQAVVFDPGCKFLVSGGTDCTFRVWA